MDVLSLAVLALAVARLTIIITTDLIFHRIREFVFLRFPPGDRVDGVDWLRVTKLNRSDWKAAKEIHGIHKERWQGPEHADAPPRPDRFVKHPHMSKRPAMIGELFSCNWCISVWVGAGVGVAYYVWPDVTLIAALPFALSMAALVVIEKGVD